MTTQGDNDAELAQDLLDRMAANKADFTMTFRRLSDAVADVERERKVRELFIDPTAFDEWAKGWRSRLSNEQADGTQRRSAMRAINPAYIPRNYGSKR